MRSILFLAVASMGLATLVSCQARKKAPQAVRTISYPSSAMMESAGASGAGAVIVETPYESPAYKAAGEAMFSRP